MTDATSQSFGINHVALLGTYVPRRCGIATFTKDLRDAIVRLTTPEGALVIAIDDDHTNLRYPQDVQFQVRTHQQSEYRLAADLLNINQVDASIVQHEYGIFGGADGGLVLNFMRHLRMPVITTLHTVLKDPGQNQARILTEMAEISDRVVVMSETGAGFLREIYKVPDRKIVVVPHGIPDVPFVDPSFYKDQFGLAGRTAMLTFGLLSPGKGIEVALNALPRVVEQFPEVVYVILGATHPNVLKSEGEAYRLSLESLVDQLDLRDHVRFHNRYVSLEELCGYIGAADLYLTPYQNVAQITSGTLAYAMGAGKAVVSTPYWYAEEMLADGRGRIAPFQGSEQFADQLIDLLSRPVERDAMRKSAYMHCRPMIWNAVAQRYLELAAESVEERRRKPRPLSVATREPLASDALPDVDLRHLFTLTDDTGIYQHAIYTIPDRTHGYTTDDNARALIAALRYNALRKDDSVLRLAMTYLSFIHGAYNPDTRRFRNFMSYDRKWLEEIGSEDSHARSLWALGEAVALAPNVGILGYATRLFSEALCAVESFSGPRPWAFALIGAHAYLRRFGGDSHVRRMRDALAFRLLDLFKSHATPDWPWCEESVTYSNARLPHALILCGQWLPNAEMFEQGIRSLEWLLKTQRNDKGALSLIGCNGWYSRGSERSLFDQQPVEVMSLIDACAEIYRATGEARWKLELRRCLDWFLGRNDIGSALYDFKTGGCRDGLNPQGANQNEGAESTLSWLISLITIHEVTGQAVTTPIPRGEGNESWHNRLS